MWHTISFWKLGKGAHKTRIADRHHFNANPDPLHKNVDPDPTFRFHAELMQFGQII
jgi:hypothetical protein